MNEKEYERAVSLKEELHIYVLQLKQSVEQCQHASLLNRNPYVRSHQAKENLKAIEDNVHSCVDTILNYVAVLAKYHICDRTQLNEFFFIYQFLFDFHDGIKKQELEHRLFIRDVEITSRFHRFFDYTLDFLQSNPK